MVGWMLRADDFVLVQGIRDTRGTLSRWSDAPGPIMRRWLLGAFAIAGALLLAVLVIALISTPDPTPVAFAGLTEPSSMEGVLVVMKRNALVLALHGFACVAGFIAGSSMPLEAQRYRGVLRWVHDKAGPLAIGFVAIATTFSLVTQAYVLGGAASTLAAQGGMHPALLLVGHLPHALPELVALFLPLAAWIIASRRDDWHELLAATFVTVGVAVPILVAAAYVEVYVSPDVIRALR
jgi:hypothetical protein